MIVQVRQDLVASGLDGGPDTIAWTLEHHHGKRVGTSTIHRYLRRAGLVVAQPQKRPRSSYIRFQADQPNETWQADFTHYRLAGGDDNEILSWLDDHARYALSITAHTRVSGPIVLDTFLAACDRHGTPASTLTDNGMVFTTRLSGGRGGRNGFEAALVRLGVVQKNSRPNHPTTCGKVERFQQTLKAWLRAQPQPATTSELQALLDAFAEIYNQQRPHRSLPQRATPTVVYHARPKAGPTTLEDPHRRVRQDIVDSGGTVTLRHDGRLHHIGIGRTHARTPAIVLVDDLDIRVVHAATGELLRHLTLDPTKNYQPTGQPHRRPPQQPAQPNPQ